MWAWLEILGNFTWPCLSPWQSFIFWLNQERSWSCPFTSRVWPWKGFVLGCSLLHPDPAGRIGMSWLALLLSHTTGLAPGTTHIPHQFYQFPAWDHVCLLSAFDIQGKHFSSKFISHIFFSGVTSFLTQICLTSLSVGRRSGCLPKRILDRNVGQELVTFDQGFSSLLSNCRLSQ